MDEDRHFHVTVPDDLEAPTRLDQFLADELADLVGSQLTDQLSRSRVRKLIDDGKIMIGDKTGKAGLKLKGGEIISIIVPADVELQLKAQDIAIDVVYEDNDLIVINKAAGMVVHPGAGVHENTLVNALLHHCRGSLSGISGVLRPGIVHRLDKDTSGLLVVAKNDRAHQSLAAQIKEKSARRIYLALLEGNLPAASGIVDKPIGRHQVDRKRMSISPTGRNARTQWELLKHWHKFCLVRATLETGRTHQIRVHMTSLNCPVVGDIVYNKKTTGTLESRQRLGLLGHALHAANLSFQHPTSGRLLEFSAALPSDYQSLLDRLDNT